MSVRSRSRRGSNNLAPDLLMEIFSRLPVKSTLKFRCVSKAWLALLTDPLSQKNLPPVMSGFFYRHQSETCLSFSSVYPGEDQQFQFSSITSSISRSIGCLNIQLRDSCNGLLLFECRDKSKRDSLIVCNPTGNTWASIDVDCAANHGMRLLFDPKTSPHFKVVMVTKAEYPAAYYHTLELLIFSSDTNDFEVSTVNRELPLFSGWLERFAIRTAYFPMHDAASGLVLKPVEVAIINESEDWPLVHQLVPLPRFSFARNEYMEILGESGGRVHYAVCCELKLLVWVLEGESWVLKHVTSTQNLIQQHKEARRRHTAGLIRPLAFHPDLDVIFLQVEWNIYSFLPSSGNSELLVSKRGGNPEESSYLFHPFKSCSIADPLANLPTVRKIDF